MRTDLETQIHTHKANVIRWIDGDTVVLDIDLDFNVWIRNQHCRLLNVNTPERGQVNWAEATQFSNSHVVPGTEIVVITYKPAPDDKYGRWLIEIPLPDGTTINQALVAAGLAVPYMVQ